MQSRPLKLSTPRDRRFRAARYRDTVIRRERLREAATKAIAQHGLAGANLRAIAAAADMETGAVRNYYFGTTQAMMEDLARWHQQRLGEAMTEVVIAARALSGPARLEALSAGLLETLAALGDGHRATVAAVHGFPAIAHNVRHGQRWLVAEMAAGLETAAPCLAGRSLLREVLAETLLMLLEDWSLRLPETEGLSRAACARVMAAAVADVGRAMVVDSAER